MSVQTNATLTTRVWWNVIQQWPPDGALAEISTCHARMVMGKNCLCACITIALDHILHLSLRGTE